MPTNRHLPHVRAKVAQALSGILTEWKKDLGVELEEHHDILSLLLRVDNLIIKQSSVRGDLPFPVVFSIVSEPYGRPTDNAHIYKVLWHPTHRPDQFTELLGQFLDVRHPRGRYISSKLSFSAYDCSGTIILPPWHTLQGIISSLNNPRPDIPVQLALRDNVGSDGHSRTVRRLGTAVIVVNANNPSQMLDVITWMPSGYEQAWRCTKCKGTVRVTERMTTYCIWRKQVGVCVYCQDWQRRAGVLQRTVKTGGTVALLALITGQAVQVVRNMYT